ncbi:MAG: hypothetical protein QW385_07645 [Thermoproteota archaeon]
MTRTSLVELFQSRRYRLLYYFYVKRKIREFPGIKSELAKLFGYESDGHFYYDWNTLLEKGFLVEKDDFIKITKKGIGEFKLLIALKIATLFSIMLGVLQLYYFCIAIIGIGIPFLFVLSILLSSSIILLWTSILCFRVLRDFTPKLPP